MITEAKLDAVREASNAMQSRKVREYANKNGSFNGSACVGYPHRFTIFMQRIKRSQRLGGKFAAHVASVENALATVVRLQEAA